MTIRLSPLMMITFIATTICLTGLLQQFNLLSSIIFNNEYSPNEYEQPNSSSEIPVTAAGIRTVVRSSTNTNSYLLDADGASSRRIVAPVNLSREERQKRGPESFHSTPMQVIHEYQQFHSQSVLFKEYQNGGIFNRTFVLGLYACPDSAGNRLHEFFNSFIMAVVMNFTITWKFFDEKTCRTVGSRAPNHWCRRLDAYNSIEKCEELIHRAPWIASFDDLANKLNLTFGKRDKRTDFYSPEHVVVYHPKLGNIPIRMPINSNKVWLPKERNLPLDLHEQGQRWTESMDVASRKRLEDLYSLGTSYLYGLVFHEIFPFQDSIKPDSDLIGAEADGNDHDVVSIVLHSRHYKDHINGTDTFYERKCIQNITRQHEIKGTNLDNCRIYIMSDRNTTLNDLSKYISRETKCKPVVARHDIDNGKFVEHGPFALKGYFQDLALAAHANGGFIGNLKTTKSSSSSLVQILYEYNHVVHNGGKFDDGTNPPLFCGLPKHRGWGELIF